MALTCLISLFIVLTSGHTLLYHTAVNGYVCDGKMPNNDRMKLITRKGIILSCGCDPPAICRSLAAMVESGGFVLSNCPRDEFAHTALEGLVAVPALDWALGTCVCAGIWLVVRVTASA